MKNLAHLEFDVLVLAPFGRDAEAATQVLAQSGIRAFPFKSLLSLCERLETAPSGALLIAEEALTAENASELKAVLAREETWSNLPIILMTSQKERVFSTEQILDLFGMSGSISILERPFRIVTLIASVRVALQARKRQYQVRALLVEQQKTVDHQKRAVQQRDEFLSIASHELKTPITSLRLQVQMRKRFLKRGDQSVFQPEKVMSLLNTTETQVERLSRLVDDMLDISRIVNGKLSLNRSDVELGALVQEVLDTFCLQFQNAECPVELKIESRAYGCWDRYRIEQVIVNLFTNAIKYGSGKPVLIQVKCVGGKGILTVQDNGMGIPPESQERIFQRFERAVVGENISGLGLGLFITRQILDLHQGVIRVSSQIGRGSTFTVELPVAMEKSSHVG